MKLKSIFFSILFLNAGFSYAQKDGRIIISDTSKTSISDKARGYYNDAYDYFDKGNFKKAIVLYKLAIAEDPDFIDAYDNLGLAFRQLDLGDSAEHYYLISLQKYPNGYTANQNLAIVEELRNNFEKALSYYKKLITLEAENPEGYYGASRMQFSLGNLEEALKNGLLAEKYYTQINSPYIGDCYYILCIISYNNKDLPLAKKYLALCKKAGIPVDKKIENALE
ncbi:MAG: tetratricopeptide repeat protein [Ferruginibacter sp.]